MSITEDHQGIPMFNALEIKHPQKSTKATLNEEANKHIFQHLLPFLLSPSEISSYSRSYHCSWTVARVRKAKNLLVYTYALRVQMHASIHN